MENDKLNRRSWLASLLAFPGAVSAYVRNRQRKAILDKVALHLLDKELSHQMRYASQVGTGYVMKGWPDRVILPSENITIRVSEEVDQKQLDEYRRANEENELIIQRLYR